MKKLLLSLTMVLAMFAASAQNITITEKETGNVVENGANYYIYGDVDPSLMEIAMEFDVTNTTGEVLNVVCEKVENNLVEGTLNYICFGLCLSPEVYSTAVDLNPGEPTLFSVHYMPLEQFGEQSMTYLFYERNNPDAKFVINITFKYSLDDVAEVAAQNVINAYPTPATDVINFDYDLNGSVNSAAVVVYNMAGQEVMRNDLNGMSGKLSMNVSDLSSGVYFYSLVINGKTEKSSKIVVR